VFTVCPKCALTLGVTAGDLRVGQGYVRCGRCSSVFNALANLHDDLAEPQRRKDEPADNDEASTAEHPVLVLEEPAGAEALPDSALEFDPQRSDAASVFVHEAVPADEPLHTGTYETIVLEGEGEGELSPDQDEEAPPAQAGAARLDDEALAADGAVAHDLPSSAAEPHPAEAARSGAASSPSGAPAPLPRVPPAGATQPSKSARGREFPAGGIATVAPLAPRLSTPAPPVVVSTASPGAATFVQDLKADQPVGENELRLRRLFAVGSIVLAVLLGLQLLHHFRDALAAQPALHATVAGLYAAIGRPLVTHWDVDAYEVRQLGASAASVPGRLMVGASLKNGARRAQPCPILRVTLQDRYGNRLAARDFDPHEYLDALPPGGMLASGQRLDTELALVDPGQNAVGFELDACLRERGGALHCASQARDR
jgi:predicted Zn finger-like uncharacterized protein